LNINPLTEPDPWPRYGLAAKYKPYILNRIKPFLENNPHLNRNEVIIDAIRITWQAGQKFKPELGNDFSTYLRHLLPNRLYDLYGIEKSETDEEPDILKTEPLQFQGGGNGARLVLDTGAMVVGARMVGNDPDYLTGTLDRIRESSAAVPPDHENAQPFLRAIADHSERRVREALAEAEQGGTVLLEPRDLQADIRLFKDNRLVRFKPTVRFYDGQSIPGGYQLEKVPKGGRFYREFLLLKGKSDPVAVARLNKIAALADLTDDERKIMQHMSNPQCTGTEFAKKIGISQGYLSKQRSKIILKLQHAGKKFLDNQDRQESWFWVDPTKIYGEDDNDD
jgi:hypothetical protein